MKRRLKVIFFKQEDGPAEPGTCPLWLGLPIETHGVRFV